MQNTIFSEFHINAGARMIPYAGYNMPVEYSGITDEHINVRNRVGVFDVSHMGEIWVTGSKAYDLLQYVTSNDISQLSDGSIQYSCFPNGKGGIVDDIMVYRFSSEKYLLVVNAANREKDWNWIVHNGVAFGLREGEGLTDASDGLSLIAVQGPLTGEVVEKLTETSINDMKHHSFRVTELAGIPGVILSMTGYTGEEGCEIYIKNDDGLVIWNALFEAGEEYGIKPAGLGARDTLRLEMGYCLYGNDINDKTSPIEAGLDWITKFKEGKDFIDKELLLEQKEKGVDRKLKGFVMMERGIPRQHYKVVDRHDNEIGEVTSGTMSPMLKTGIGMAYVNKDNWMTNNEVFIRIRNKKLQARIVDLPIYRKK